MKKYYLGIDWGGTFIKAGVVDLTGKIHASRVIRTDHLSRRNVFFQKVDGLLYDFRLYSLRGIGVGAPGIINVLKGKIHCLTNVPGWDNYPLRKKLEEKFSLPAFVDNDANVFALAESRFGAAKKYQRAVFLTLGTGLGGAVSNEGKILRGEFSAGELGHVPVSLHGRKCNCGARGCVETMVGSNYLMKRYCKLKNIKFDEETAERGVKYIFERAVEGESPALSVWKEFSFGLGRFLAGMINVFNPEIVVFGGGVSGAFKIFAPMVRAVIRDNAMSAHVKNLKLVRARLKNSGVIGAAVLVMDEDRKNA